ncbi:MAG: serine hydrolase domain-containing protein [Cellulosilyticaceae bacterium]
MKSKKWLMGIAVLVVTGLLLGSVYGKGESQLTGNTPVADDYVIQNYEMYGIGSVSKVFGAVAVMQLVQDGQVDLDAPLTTYIPEFEMADARYKEITPRMLLNHTSGLLGFSSHNAMLFGQKNEDYKEQVLSSLKTQRLKADPGAFSVYCNDGFTLAEILVERVSGMSFSEFVATRIAKPLGMERTYTSMDDMDMNGLAKTYLLGMETPYEAVAPLASGGIYSTAEDLCKFSSIFMDSQELILNQSSKDEMAKPWYLQDKIGAQKGDSMFAYGLGWDAVETYPFNQYGIQALSKGGDTIVYHSNLTVLPEQNMSVAVVSSGGNSAYCQLAAQEILLEVLKEEGIISDIHEEKAFEKQAKVAIPEELKRYAGFYQANTMLEVMFTENDTMVLKELDGKYPSEQEYVYTENGRFVSHNGQYISPRGELVAAENGIKGVTYLSFSEESNGQTYILSSSYESTPGLGKSAFTVPVAQKIQPVTLSEQVRGAWQQREGKKYYVVSESAGGSHNLTMPYIEMGLLESVSGYTKSLNGSMNTRIINENLSRAEIQIPGVLGRDLKDYMFYKQDGVEYLKCLDLLFVSEDEVQSTTALSGQCQIGVEGYTKWYAVTEQDSGKEIVMDVPAGGAYYIYNEEGNCIGSSILKQNSSKVTLPTKGKISLVGGPGAIFTIKSVD